MTKHFKTISAVALSLLLLTACDIEIENSDSKKKSKKSVTRSQNRINWSKVSSEFNPSVEEIGFQTSGFEKLSINAFGFDEDVEIVYLPDLQTETGYVRIFKVWKEFASWGDTQARARGTSLDVSSYGSYQCSIRITNGKITALKGGCYVRLQIFLPIGSELEVYNVGQLISKRFVPMDTETFIDQIEDAIRSDDKFVVVIDEFIRSEDRFRALRRLHPFVSDRENLNAMIESEFSFFEREEAKKIVGL